MSLKSVHAGLAKVNRILCILGGMGILALSLIVVFDVVIRKIFGVTLGGANELAGFIFAAAISFSLPLVLMERANIRIDLFYNFARPSLRAVLDLLALLAMLFFAAMLSSKMINVFMASWHGNVMTIGIMRVPLWIPQFFWVLGYVLLTLTAAFLCFYSIVLISKRLWGEVGRIAGVPSLQETIEDETHLEPETQSNTKGSV